MRINFGKFDTPYSSYPCTGATEDEMTLYYQLGTISHKMTLITIFGHTHFRQKFHQNFFTRKFSTAYDFGSYRVSVLEMDFFRRLKMIGKPNILTCTDDLYVAKKWTF